MNEHMFSWLSHFSSPIPFSWHAIVIFFILFVSVFISSTAFAVFFLIRLPPTYFSRTPESTIRAKRRTIIHWVGVICKNMLGLVLILIGLVLSLPGVLGPGIVMLFIGITLLDFPYKRELEHKFIRNPRILRAINRLRKRFSQPPFIVR